jgi:hypothetical protein
MLHVPWYCSNFVHIGEGLLMRESMEPLLYKYGVDIVLTEASCTAAELERGPCVVATLALRTSSGYSHRAKDGKQTDWT